MMKKWVPKLVISKYFDSLTRNIDIYTEELLDRFPDNHLSQKPEQQPKNEHHKPETKRTRPRPPLSESDSKRLEKTLGNDCFHIYEDLGEKYNVEDNKNRFEETRKEINTREYINSRRDEMLRELERAEREAFVSYERIKSKLKTNKKLAIESSSGCYEDKRDELMSQVLADEYVFVLGLKSSRTRGDSFEPYKLFLVVLDFYLNRNERQLFRDLLVSDSSSLYFETTMDPNNNNNNNHEAARALAPPLLPIIPNNQLSNNKTSIIVNQVSSI